MGGGGGAVTTSAPVSGDGSAGDPVTIADGAIDTDALEDGAVTLAKLDSGVHGPLSNTGRHFVVPNSGVGGSGNAITLDTGQSLTSLQHGDFFFFTSTASNTGATTVTVDTASAVAIERADGQGASSGLTGGEITSNDPIFLIYTSAFGGKLYFMPARAGTAAFRNAGAATNDVPILGSGGALSLGVIPNLTANQLANNSVGTSEIQANAVGSSEIATNAVGSAKLINNAVTQDKIADGAVTVDKMNSGFRHRRTGRDGGR